MREALEAALAESKPEAALELLLGLRAQGLYPSVHALDQVIRLLLQLEQVDRAYLLARREGIPLHAGSYRLVLEALCSSNGNDAAAGGTPPSSSSSASRRLVQAMIVLEEMRSRAVGVAPGPNHYLAVLGGCAEVGDWREALRLRREMMEEAGEQAPPDVHIKARGLVLKALARDGQGAKALRLLEEETPRKGAAAAEQFAAGLAAVVEGTALRDGGLDGARRLATEAAKTPGGASPAIDAAVALALLSACKRLGLWEEALALLKEGAPASGTPLTPVHAALALGACGTATPPQPAAALALFRSMGREGGLLGVQPDAVAYLELLEACWRGGGRGGEAVALLLGSRQQPPSPASSSYYDDLRAYHGAMRASLRARDHGAVLRLWTALRSRGLKPATATRNYLLRAGLNSGRWKEALAALEEEAGEEEEEEEEEDGSEMEGEGEEEGPLPPPEAEGPVSGAGGGGVFWRLRAEPALLREMFLVGVTAHERAGDWGGVLAVLQDMARALAPSAARVPTSEAPGGGQQQQQQQQQQPSSSFVMAVDPRLARTCNRAVTSAVRERRWEQVRWANSSVVVRGHNIIPMPTPKQTNPINPQAVALHAAMAALGVPADLMARNAAMKALAELGQAEAALALLDATVEAGLAPDEVSLSTVIHACGRAGQWEKVRACVRACVPQNPPVGLSPDPCDTHSKRTNKQTHWYACTTYITSGALPPPRLPRGRQRLAPPLRRERRGRGRRRRRLHARGAGRPGPGAVRGDAHGGADGGTRRRQPRDSGDDGDAGVVSERLWRTDGLRIVDDAAQCSAHPKKHNNTPQTTQHNTAARATGRGRSRCWRGWRRKGWAPTSSRTPPPSPPSAAAGRSGRRCGSLSGCAAGRACSWTNGATTRRCTPARGGSATRRGVRTGMTRRRFGGGRWSWWGRWRRRG